MQHESAKMRVLRAVARFEPVTNPHELQIHTNMATRDVVHILYSLQKQGLIRFAKTKRPPAWKGKPANTGVSQKVPTRIRLTERGKEQLGQT